MDFIIPSHTPIKTNKIGLIDADFIKYKVIAKIQKELNSKEVILHKTAYNAVATHTQTEIDRLFDLFEPKALIFCFSGVTEYNFRYMVAHEKKYKGNRTSQLLYDNQEDDKFSVIKYIKSRYPTILFKDLEADDVLSMLQDQDTFILSEDKDLLQCAGTHWSLDKQTFIEIPKKEAYVNLMRQMLLGDTVDNIGGLKSCGEIGTYELLTNNNVADYHQIILQAYIDKHGIVEGIDRFTETWNLVKLRLNRGTYFKSKYALAFDTLEMVKLEE